MKIALYIEDGLEQIVLTPEGDTERSILAKLTDETRTLEIKHGSFYECRGGWMRHKASFIGLYDRERKDDDSTMLVLRQRQPEPPSSATGSEQSEHRDAQKPTQNGGDGA